ncbi:exodeoxyribonuclease III [Bifidobacterium cuniculi]|uniref:Exodeoxyribonuclease n=1 Tax=Bifidobacterium cuniculi TaxID=1688 RepID=A0A087B3L8_9BIFI|nr:exodeoxyribonuclease III [Bifidobacterium cuniculi]KFI65618.1 exodeoxyribonuclease [Bifidobacterium cuniculi]
MTVTITTSNMNGIRAAKRKGLHKWVMRNTPDIWCMQEVRAPQSEIDPIIAEIAQDYVEAGRLSAPADLASSNEVCKVKGRAGVAIVSDLPVLERRYGLEGLDEDVDTGRWIETDIRTPQGYVITVVCVYVHAGNVDDPVKMGQKYRFLEKMTERLGQLQDEAAHGGRQAVVCGDYNVAHEDIDINNPAGHVHNSGFLPEERAYLDRWLKDLDYVDVMRDLAGDIQGPYTWWSMRGRAFDNDAGWRLDYQFATPELAQAARGFVVDKPDNYFKRWSDHAPLTITYDV